MPARGRGIKQPERQEALAASKRFYRTGVPCKHGHHSKRFTKSSICLTCYIYSRWNLRAWRRQWYAENAERLRPIWREKAKERRKHLSKEKREYHLEATRQYRRKNPKIVLADCRARQLAKRNRTPKWADLRVMRRFYQQTPDGMTVDHIVPLRGKTVSGLHVAENLQYLSPFDNMSKRNKFDDWADAA